MSLIDRALKIIWKVVGGDEISKQKFEIYTKNLSFEPYLFHLLQKFKKKGQQEIKRNNFRAILKEKKEN